MSKPKHAKKDDFLNEINLLKENKKSFVMNNICKLPQFRTVN